MRESAAAFTLSWCSPSVVSSAHVSPLRPRYATSVAISQATFSPGVPVAFIATGADFPDALSGGPVAGMDGGPLLLTRATTLPSAVAEEMSRLQPGRIVVLGGTSSVSAAVEDQLAAHTTGSVTRLAGPDRYATSALISQASFSPGVGAAYIATGEDFPDALSGAPVAGMHNTPVLLARATSLPTMIADELTRLAPHRIVVLGAPPRSRPGWRPHGRHTHQAR